MLRFYCILIYLCSFMVLITCNRNILSRLSNLKLVNNSYQNVILYDGVCNFCNTWVDLVLKVDSNKKFSFCALQSENGKVLLEYIGKDRNDLSSVIYIKKLYLISDYDKSNSNDASISNKHQIYIKSEAALRVAEELGVPPFLVNVIMRLFPKFIRDNLYDTVAYNRYNILGKREECRCSDPNESDRFI